MENNSSFKMVAHLQRVIYVILIALIFLVFFSIVACFSDTPWAFVIVAFLFAGTDFLIMYFIFHRDFTVVKMDEDGIYTSKRKIKWEEIERVELKENKINLTRGAIIEFRVGGRRTIYLDSTVHIYGKDGKDIRFAINKESYKALCELCGEKSDKVKELLDKISV